MASEIRALVFDFDGLILDTEVAVVEAWIEVFESYGAVFPVAAWLHNVGLGAEQERMAPLDHLELQVGSQVDPDAVQASQSEAHVRRVAQLEPMPGVREAVRRAGELGIKLAVATSSPHDWVDPLLAAHGLSESFGAVLCADDVQRAKPFPDLYMAACLALDVEPSTAVALEDSQNGIAAAKAAGLRCVAVPNRVTAQMDLSAADLRVESLADRPLDELIAELNNR